MGVSGGMGDGTGGGMVGRCGNVGTEDVGMGSDGGGGEEDGGKEPNGCSPDKGADEEDEGEDTENGIGKSAESGLKFGSFSGGNKGAYEESATEEEREACDDDDGQRKVEEDVDDWDKDAIGGEMACHRTRTPLMRIMVLFFFCFPPVRKIIFCPFFFSFLRTFSSQQGVSSLWKNQASPTSATALQISCW